MVLLVILITTVPLIWLLFSVVDYKRGKIAKVKWKGPLKLFLTLALLVLIHAIYLNIRYNIPIFINLHSASIALITVLIIGGVFSLANIITTLKVGRTHYHNPTLMWKFIGVFMLVMLTIIIWFLPAGEKMKYVRDLNFAYEKLNEKDEDIAVILASSESNCLRAESTRPRYTCDSYANVFYVKNNFDQSKEVQLSFRVFNRQEEELEVIESHIMKLEPEEIKLVITDETQELNNSWSQYSFETEETVHYYQYKKRYRDIDSDNKN